MTDQCDVSYKDPSMDVIMTTYKVLNERISDIHTNDGFSKKSRGLIWHSDNYYCNTYVKEAEG